MKIRSKSLLFLLLMSGIATAQATESAQFAVGGEIRPSACDVTIANDGVLDFGTIPASALDASSKTVLPLQTTLLTVTCSAPTAVAYAFIDGRPGTVEASTAGSAPEWKFGLGAVDGKKIGSYQIYLSGEKVDGDDASVDTLVSSGGGAWHVKSSDQYVDNDNSQRFSWGANASPGAYSVMHQALKVQPIIAKKSSLTPLTEAIPLDGLATISLSYL